MHVILLQRKSSDLNSGLVPSLLPFFSRSLASLQRSMTMHFLNENCVDKTIVVVVKTCRRAQLFTSLKANHCQDINNGGFANLMEYFLDGSGSPFRLCKVREKEKIIAIGMKKLFL